MLMWNIGVALVLKHLRIALKKTLGLMDHIFMGLMLLGLPQAVKAHLADCGEQHSKIKLGRGPEVRMMPGTTLIREWDRREYRVTVLPDGLYELNGQRYKSLSAAARHITGTQWNGPKFFGLRDGKAGGQ